MKKSDKKAIGNGLLSGLFTVAKTAVSGLNPVVGMALGAAEGTVKAIKKEKEKNLSSSTGGEGNINYPMLIGQIVSATIIIGGGISLIFGWLTIEDLKELIKLWENTQ